jgi:hypothetical protein
MELNGIANISMVMWLAQQDKLITNDTVNKIDTQLAILTTYLKEYKKWSDKAINAAKNGEQIPNEPIWHEVKAKLGLENT